MNNLPQHLRDKVYKYWSPSKEIKRREELLGQILVRREISRLVTLLWDYRETLSSTPFSEEHKELHKLSLTYCLEALFEGCFVPWLSKSVLSHHVIMNLSKYNQMYRGFRSTQHNVPRKYPKFVGTIDCMTPNDIANIITSLVNDCMIMAMSTVNGLPNAKKIDDVYRDIYDALLDHYKFIEYGYPQKEPLPVKRVGMNQLFGII